MVQIEQSPPRVSGFKNQWMVGPILFSVVLGLAMITFCAALTATKVVPVWAVGIFVGGYVVVVCLIWRCCYGCDKLIYAQCENAGFHPYQMSYIATHRAYVTPSTACNQNPTNGTYPTHSFSNNSACAHPTITPPCGQSVNTSGQQVPSAPHVEKPQSPCCTCAVHHHCSGNSSAGVHTFANVNEVRGGHSVTKASPPSYDEAMHCGVNTSNAKIADTVVISCTPEY